ncbi:MAG: Lrp/AsnC family transcriptional regulator [Spirochaetes bacterium]|jgi:DNA-binding Lrp family transcriptional regulator|nr:Lrp/AsnC family transcriptional regulator [Spirochaetota bacterium]
MTRFSRAEERIINRIQEDIPLAVDPFGRIADELSMPESELLETVARLKEKRIVRNISAIFNAHRLGYHSSLVAFSVAEGDVDGAVAVINAHPGVSHNYLRDHRYNIWFTLAVDASTSLEETASVLARLCRAADHLILRNEKLFKIGFMLRMGDDAQDDEDEDAAPVDAAVALDDGEYALSDEERDAVLLLQTDLPITGRPFDEIVARAGSPMDAGRLVAIGDELKRKGIMRRYAAVLKHYNAGYGANAMTAWKIGPGRSEEEVMPVFLSNKSISHLYRRTEHPGRWEHPLFAMIHARSDGELDGIIAALEERSGLSDYLVLKSLREFKKKRVTYFSPAFDEWKKENMR